MFFSPDTWQHDHDRDCYKPYKMNRNDQEPLSFSAASIRLSLLFLASPMLGTSHYLKEHKVLNETMDKKQTLMRSLIDELGMLE